MFLVLIAETEQHELLCVIYIHRVKVAKARLISMCLGSKIN
jgi:hypothetical protein